jgi:hypothetical protein
LFVTVATPQLSLLVGVPKTMPVPVQLVMAGGAVIVGFSLSVTVTAKEHEDVLPDASVAVKTLFVTPTGKVEPLAKPVKLLVNIQLSVADTVKLTFAPQTPKSVFILRGVGHVITGFSLSIIVTVEEQDAVLPAASVALNVIVDIPTGNVAPLAKPEGCVMVAEQLSVADGEPKVTIAPQTPKSVFLLRGVGQVICGAILSTTVTVKLQVVALSDISDALKI